ncbi:MAG: hypothetical protein Q9188_000816 [Gyalolechia gomerana]
MASRLQTIRELGISISQLRQNAPPRLSNQETIARYGFNNVTQQPAATVIQPQEQTTETPPPANSVPRFPPGVAASPIDLTDDDKHPAQGFPCPPAAVSTPASQPSSANSQGKRKHHEWMTADPKSGPPRPTKKPKMAKAPVMEKVPNAPAKMSAKEQESKTGRGKRSSGRPSKKQKAWEFNILVKNHGDEFFKIFGLPKDDEVTITAVRHAGMTSETKQSNEAQETDVAKDSNEIVLPEDPQRRKAFVAEKLREKHEKEAQREIDREKARMEMNREEARTGITRNGRAQEPDELFETNEDEVTGEEFAQFMEEKEEEEQEIEREVERGEKEEREKKETEIEAEKERQKRRWAEESGESSEEE